VFWFSLQLLSETFLILRRTERDMIINVYRSACKVFPHDLINGPIFGKKLLNTKCVFWFSLQLLSETFLIIRRTERDMIINAHRSSCEIALVLDRSLKMTQIQNFMKIRPVTDGRTDMAKPTVSYGNF
jgi:hypothetical protein